MTASARPRVLLIDGDPEILKLMEYAFDGEPMDLATCRTPEEGLRQVASQDFACVLLDVHFARTPESLGFLSALGRLPGKAGTPVLATSSMVGPEVARQVLRLGARKFIPKPFSPVELLREVRALVRHPSSTGAAA